MRTWVPLILLVEDVESVKRRRAEEELEAAECRWDLVVVGFGEVGRGD